MLVLAQPRPGAEPGEASAVAVVQNLSYQCGIETEAESGSV